VAPGQHDPPTVPTSSTGWVGDILPGLLLSLAIIALLAAYPVADQTGDSTSYLIKAQSGGRMLHPHHLLFNPAVRIVYLGLMTVTGVRNVVLAAQIHNLLFALVALLAVYWIGLRCLGTRATALLGLALYGGTTGILVYATQAEVYIPSVAALGVAASFVLRLVESPSSAAARAGFIASWTLAILYHQTAVLFIAPIAALAWMVRSRDLARALAISASVSGTIVLVAYGIAYRTEALEVSNPRSFLGFIFSYVVRGGERWGHVSNLTGTGLVELLTSHLWGLSTLIANRPPVLFAVAGVGVAAFIASFRAADGSARLVLCLAGTWAGTLLLFFLWWLPREAEFAVLTSMPICLAATACLSVLGARLSPESRQQWTVFAAAMTIALVNLAANFRIEVLPRHTNFSDAFQRAQFLATFDDGRTLRISRHRVVASTRFYFPDTAGSVGAANHLERALHHRSSDSMWLNRSRWERVVVDVDQIHPQALHNGRTGMREPATWLRMIQWVFNLRESGDQWYVDGWEMVSEKRGNQYLVVSSTTSAPYQPRRLLRSLCDAMQPSSNAQRSFRWWLQDNDVLLDAHPTAD
jgi:hypothetical protein